jgi:hypothetical protein
MRFKKTKTFIPVALLVATIAATVASPQEISRGVKAVQVIGLSGVKDNAKGVLSVKEGNLHFVHRQTTSDVSARSILDIATGSDSQKAVGKAVSTIGMAAPYGGGRFLSLFRRKIDTLTVEYCDSEGALHGAIFTMPVGTAEPIREQLIAQGAHTSTGALAGKEHK